MNKVRALSNEAILGRLAGFGSGFKLHFAPEMTRVRDVDVVFHGTEYFYNWCQEFENELSNAGVHDPRYWRQRVQYVKEFLAQFVEEDEQPLLGNFLRAEARRSGAWVSKPPPKTVTKR